MCHVSSQPGDVKGAVTLALCVFSALLPSQSQLSSVCCFRFDCSSWREGKEEQKPCGYPGFLAG